MTNNAALILTGATIVGGFVLGKAVVDHVLISHGRSLDEDADEFEEQHYRAAGFRQKARPQLDSAVAIVAGLVGVGYTIYATPDLVKSLQALAQ